MNGRFVSAAADCLRSRKGHKPDRVVIHTGEGSEDAIVTWFTRTGAQRVAAGGSSLPTATHYVVSKVGRVTQMVADDEACIHAGSKTEPYWNERSFGIEHEDRANDAIPPTEAMLDASAEVVAILCHKYAIPADRQHIVGHSEVPGHGSHTDPGPLWPWDAYMAKIHAHLAVLTGGAA